MPRVLQKIKSKTDRLKEGVAILKQLRDAGVKEHSLGYLDLKTKISEWVNSENAWDGSIDFSEYGRVADVELPRYDNRAAGINFKVKKPF